jgi:hypothetical protein
MIFHQHRASGLEVIPLALVPVDLTNPYGRVSVAGGKV